MADIFTQAYIECALWSSSEGEDGEIRLDEYGGDIAPGTLHDIEEACAQFQADNADLLRQWYDHGETAARAGHDFWLTRNHHGAGFWDRFYGDHPACKIGNALTAYAHAVGSRDLYIGDDGQIYQD
jgi:hypothetical protein